MNIKNMSGVTLAAVSLALPTLATTVDGLPSVVMDPSWTTENRANYVSTPETQEGVFDVLDSYPFSWDVKEFIWHYGLPGLQLIIR